MREIKLPPELDVGESYGKLSWTVRGIYEGYVGWFDGNVSTMFGSASQAYGEIVTLAGGPDAVAARALALAATDPIRALYLTDMSLAADARHKPSLAGADRRPEDARHAVDEQQRAWLAGRRNSRGGVEAQVVLRAHETCLVPPPTSVRSLTMASKFAPTLLAALVLGLLVPYSAAAQGGGASSTGTIQGRVADASGAVLPGVTVTATSPSMIGAQTQVTNENGTYRFPAVPPGVYDADVRAGRLQHGQARRHPDLARLHRQRQRRTGGRDAAGDRDRHRRLAGDRHLGDARAAELQAGAARIDSERPRHVGAAGRDARRDHEPHRRRRQPRRHADRLHAPTA